MASKRDSKIQNRQNVGPFSNYWVDGFVLVPILLHSKRKGYVTIRSTDPFEYPIIEPNYLSNEEDMAKFIEVSKRTIDLLDTKPF
ncbi:hypothetical protein DPMN_165206 [Dreissena polymorpha]|uniref:Glucose-methanol-choline oxidoreductase C-terminal domain-containing protein n=1 Tax=Dreissena polymorpha TaxID=45954 RepID=A0A9D4IWC5_DREPO|nr:hypothetical protein DPMN_165206 [Dreissena polymorpha]